MLEEEKKWIDKLIFIDAERIEKGWDREEVLKSLKHSHSQIGTLLEEIESKWKEWNKNLEKEAGEKIQYFNLRMKIKFLWFVHGISMERISITPYKWYLGWGFYVGKKGRIIEGEKNKWKSVATDDKSGLYIMWGFLPSWIATGGSPEESVIKNYQKAFQVMKKLGQNPDQLFYFRKIDLPENFFKNKDDEKIEDLKNMLKENLLLENLEKKSIIAEIKDFVTREETFKIFISFQKLMSEGIHLTSILNALFTKPFLILAGVSGTGKTQIARIIAGGCSDITSFGGEITNKDEEEMGESDYALIKIAWCGTGYWKELKPEEVIDLGLNNEAGWRNHKDGFPHESWNFNEKLVEHGKMKGYLEHVGKDKLKPRHVFLISQKNKKDWYIVGFLGNIEIIDEEINWDEFKMKVQPSLNNEELLGKIKTYIQRVKEKGKSCEAIGRIPKSLKLTYEADENLSVLFFPEEGFITEEEIISLGIKKAKKDELITNIGNVMRRRGVYITSDSALKILETAKKKHEQLLEKYKGSSAEGEIKKILERLKHIINAVSGR